MTNMDKLISEYTIVAYVDPEKMIEVINQKIKEGWQPYGELNTEKPYDVYFQVMVKYK